MRHLADIRERTPKSEIFRGQVQHAMLAILLTVGACSLLVDVDGTLWGKSALCWAQIAMAAALVHQILVAIIFRAQLHLNLLVGIFGDNALKLWGIVFLPLLVSRPILLLCAGIADAGSLGGSRALQIIAGLLLMVPAVYGMHSVIKYFTLNRALGGDHFYDRFANMPMVREGIFRFSDNAMYSYVFLGLWGIALLCGSWNAIVVALFNHAYIWVHMYCTEDPDMKVIYGEPNQEPPG